MIVVYCGGNCQEDFLGLGCVADPRLVRILVKVRRRLGEKDFEYLDKIIRTKANVRGLDGFGIVLKSLVFAGIPRIRKGKNR